MTRIVRSIKQYCAVWLKKKHERVVGTELWHLRLDDRRWECYANYWKTIFISTNILHKNKSRAFPKWRKIWRGFFFNGVVTLWYDIGMKLYAIVGGLVKAEQRRGLDNSESKWPNCISKCPSLNSISFFKNTLLMYYNSYYVYGTLFEVQCT